MVSCDSEIDATAIVNDFLDNNNAHHKQQSTWLSISDLDIGNILDDHAATKSARSTRRKSTLRGKKPALHGQTSSYRRSNRHKDKHKRKKRVN